MLREKLLGLAKKNESMMMFSLTKRHYILRPEWVRGHRVKTRLSYRRAEQESNRECKREGAPTMPELFGWFASECIAAIVEAEDMAKVSEALVLCCKRFGV